MRTTDVIYAYHDEGCPQYEYKSGLGGRVDDGTAVGYINQEGEEVLFDDVTVSKGDDTYWSNFELETDINRVVIP